MQLFRTILLDRHKCQWILQLIICLRSDLYQGERVESDSQNKGRVHGRMKWNLRFHWTPGGEDFVPKGMNLATPWWAPAFPQPGDAEATPYMNRKDLLRNCHSLLPLAIVAGQGPYAGNVLPRGWYCISCGKLNKQIFFRHRKCVCSYQVIMLSLHAQVFL
jgi:hypothetical protein